MNKRIKKKRRKIELKKIYEQGIRRHLLKKTELGKSLRNLKRLNKL